MSGNTVMYIIMAVIFAIAVPFGIVVSIRVLTARNIGKGAQGGKIVVGDNHIEIS